jgi:hypothetical protein
MHINLPFSWFTEAGGEMSSISFCGWQVRLLIATGILMFSLRIVDLFSGLRNQS